jgi:hypothetical protein
MLHDGHEVDIRRTWGRLVRLVHHLVEDLIGQYPVSMHGRTQVAGCI